MWKPCRSVMTMTPSVCRHLMRWGVHRNLCMKRGFREGPHWDIRTLLKGGNGIWPCFLLVAPEFCMIFFLKKCCVCSNLLSSFEFYENWHSKSCTLHGGGGLKFIYSLKSNPITGLDRPWGFQKVEAPRFQSAHEGGKPYAPAAFTPQEIFLVLFSVIGFSQPQGHSTARKIPMTPSGIEPAHCLNQLRHRVPHL